MFTCLPEPGYFLGSVKAVIDRFSMQDDLVYLEGSNATFIFIPENFGSYVIDNKILHISYEAALSDNSANPTAWSIIVRPLGVDA